VDDVVVWGFVGAHGQVLGVGVVHTWNLLSSPWSGLCLEIVLTSCRMVVKDEVVLVLEPPEHLEWV